jgi:hypothetical protein
LMIWNATDFISRTRTSGSRIVQSEDWELKDKARANARALC